jgi:hypothetical protein
LHAQILLNSDDKKLGAGRTLPSVSCSDGTHAWTLQNTITIPISPSECQSAMLWVRLYDSTSPPLLCCESMVWLRDVLDPSKPLACETGHDVTIDLFPDRSDAVHAHLVINLRLCRVARPLVPSGSTQAQSTLPLRPQLASAIQGILLVSVLYGVDLPNREWFGKQDPYAIGCLKQIIHPNNRHDGAATPQVPGRLLLLLQALIYVFSICVVYAVAAAAHTIYRSFQYREVRRLSAGVDSQQ